MSNTNITIKARVGLAMAFLSVLLLALGILGLSGMTSANNADRDIYTNQMPSAIAIANAEIYAARERLALDRAAFEAGMPTEPELIAGAASLRTVSDTWWKKYLELPRDADENGLAQDVATKRDTLHQVFASALQAI